jgi:hypothetical protein
LSFQLSLTRYFLFDLRFKLLIFELFCLDLSVDLRVMLVGSEEARKETDNQACSCSIRSGKSAA